MHTKIKNNEYRIMSRKITGNTYLGYYCGGMYNDCAVEMEPECAGNHEDLKAQAP